MNHSSPIDSPNRAMTIWLTGMSGAGKTTIARLLEERLRAEQTSIEVLDGDVVRTHLSKGLGFSKEDRHENVRRIGFVCELLNRHGITAIVAAISPYRDSREYVRKRLAHFVEVHVACPLEMLVQRDVKGLYQRALAGEIPRFTGISDPYEEPEHPDLVVHTDRESAEESAARIWQVVESVRSSVHSSAGARLIAASAGF